jgi:tRNA U54 and U55 pseudouridine synthase Pus10
MRMDDFDSLMETLLSAIGETPQMDHGPQNRPSEVRRILHKLRQSPLIDQPSFLANLRTIPQIKGDGGATQGQIARMFDRFAEFRVAEHFLTMVTSDLAEDLLIAFSEAPDIHVTVGGQGLQFGVEVKRPRLRAQDHVDEANLQGATREDTLIIYGNPKRVQEYLEEKVSKKQKQLSIDLPR